MSGKPIDVFGVRINANVDQTRSDTSLTPSQPEWDAVVRWSDFPPEERPASPADDYYYSEICYSETEMLDRWTDIPGARVAIRQIFREPFITRMAKRAQHRIELSNATQVIDVTDPAYDHLTLNRMTLLFDEMIFNELTLTSQGKEPHMRRVVDDNGLHWEEGWRTQTADDRIKHFRAVDVLFKLRQLAQGKATSIVENRKGTVSEIDDLRSFVEETVRQRRQYDVDMQETALPEPDVVDAAFDSFKQVEGDIAAGVVPEEKTDSVAWSEKKEEGDNV